MLDLGLYYTSLINKVYHHSYITLKHKASNVIKEYMGLLNLVLAKSNICDHTCNGLHSENRTQIMACDNTMLLYLQ